MKATTAASIAELQLRQGLSRCMLHLTTIVSVGITFLTLCKFSALRFIINAKLPGDGTFRPVTGSDLDVIYWLKYRSC